MVSPPEDAKQLPAFPGAAGWMLLLPGRRVCPLPCAGPRIHVGRRSDVRRRNWRLGFWVALVVGVLLRTSKSGSFNGNHLYKKVLGNQRGRVCPMAPSLSEAKSCRNQHTMCVGCPKFAEQYSHCRPCLVCARPRATPHPNFHLDACPSPGRLLEESQLLPWCSRVPQAWAHGPGFGSRKVSWPMRYHQPVTFTKGGLKQVYWGLRLRFRF